MWYFPAQVLLVNDEVNQVIEGYKAKVEPHLNKLVTAARAEPNSTTRQSDSAEAQSWSMHATLFILLSFLVLLVSYPSVRTP